MAMITSPGIKQAVPLFMVVNMQRSLDFYTKGLGFELKNTWEPAGKIDWCWLQLDNASIMLQEYREIPSIENRGEGITINFVCEDALAVYDRMIANGLSPSEPFVGNNMWVVPLKDPDGYKLFFESATDVPEETKYFDWTKNK